MLKNRMFNEFVWILIKNDSICLLPYPINYIFAIQT